MDIESHSHTSYECLHCYIIVRARPLINTHVYIHERAICVFKCIPTFCECICHDPHTLTINQCASTSHVQDEESKKSKMGNPCILVKLEQRNKRKCVTIVKGMDSVDTGMTIKKCAQKFSKRFACSASVQKTKEGPEIHVQGDIMWDIGEFLIETFEVDSSVLYKLGKGNIKKKLM